MIVLTDQILLTKEEIKKLKHDAYNEGYIDGYEDGCDEIDELWSNL